MCLFLWQWVKFGSKFVMCVCICRDKNKYFSNGKSLIFSGGEEVNFTILEITGFSFLRWGRRDLGLFRFPPWPSINHCVPAFIFHQYEVLRFYLWGSQALQQRQKMSSPCYYVTQRVLQLQHQFNFQSTFNEKASINFLKKHWQQSYKTINHRNRI